jgi:hypothetical protein
MEWLSLDGVFGSDQHAKNHQRERLGGDGAEDLGKARWWAVRLPITFFGEQ